MRDTDEFQFSRGEGSRHILVVEDEKCIRELIAYNLVREAFHVTSVSTGESALAIAHARRPNLILLDVMLPGIDGLEVCRRLKRDSATSSIPVVIVSARHEPEDVKNGYRAQASAYITKPFRPRVLIDKVRQLLGIPTSPDSEPRIPEPDGSCGIDADHQASRDENDEVWGDGLAQI